MSAPLDRVLKLEVPIVVLIGQRKSTVAETLQLAPGMIIELPKNAEDELELLVNNKVIATGTAVKVGENFGLKLAFVGDLKQRVLAMGPDNGSADGMDENDLDALAEMLLADQL